MKQHREFYDVLGVKPDATQDEIKKAFRAEAKGCHPDHHPGNAEKEDAFKELSRAYTVLSDPASRRHYDECGEAPPIDDILSEAYGMIIQVFQQIKRHEGDDIFYSNVFYQMNIFLDEARADLNQQISELLQQNKRNDKLAKKITYKHGTTESFIHTALSEENRANTAKIDNMRHGLEVMKKASSILEDYTFQAEKRPKDGSHVYTIDPSFDPYAFLKGHKATFRTWPFSPFTSGGKKS